MEEADADGAQLAKIQADLVTAIEIILLYAQSTGDLTPYQKIREQRLGAIQPILAKGRCETRCPFVLLLVLDFCRNEYRAFHSSIEYFEDRINT